LFARTLNIKNPLKASFSANTRNIVVQSGQQFAIYDAETDRQYIYDLDKKIDTGRPAEWMDGHRLATVTEGKVTVFDFDGTNIHQLMPSVAALDVQFDRDYDYAFTIEANSDNAAKLSVTKLYVTR